MESTIVEIDGVKYIKKVTLIPIKTEKKCYNCGEIKNLTEFHKSKNRPDGVNGKCKECTKKYHKNRNKTKNNSLS